MPEKLMRLLEQLKEVSMEDPKLWYNVNFWDNGKFEVFITSRENLPNGVNPKFVWRENIKRWEKTVTVNGIPYSTFVTQEEVDKEVAK